MLLLQAGRVQAAAQDDSWCAASGQHAVADVECAALEAFYHSTNGGSWLDSTGWLESTAVCTDWIGVACDEGHVSSLTLVSNNLSGQLPPSLGDLSKLNTLDLSANQIGGAIPPQLGRLEALNDLSLGANRLQGRIPPQLGQLNALAALDLGDNRLEGSIPAELGALENLSAALYLDGNRLEGPIPPAVCELSPLLASVDYNKLDVFATEERCDDLFSRWRATQTAAPAALSVSSLGVTTSAATAAVVSASPPGAATAVGKTDAVSASPGTAAAVRETDAVSASLGAAAAVGKTDAVSASLGAAAAVRETDISSDVLLQWIPASYSGGEGSYEVLTRRHLDGEIKSRGRTKDKTAYSLQVSIDGDPKAYAYFVRTHTAAHASNQSALTSAGGDEVEIAAVVPRALDIRPNLPDLYIPLLAPLALLLFSGIAVLIFRRR